MPREGYDSLTLKTKLVEKIDSLVDKDNGAMGSRSQVIDYALSILKEKTNGVKSILKEKTNGVKS